MKRTFTKAALITILAVGAGTMLVLVWEDPDRIFYVAAPFVFMMLGRRLEDMIAEDRHAQQDAKTGEQRSTG